MLNATIHYSDDDSETTSLSQATVTVSNKTYTGKALKPAVTVKLSGRRPSAVILENVRSLKTHDKGRTFAVIKNVLEKELGYTVFDDILNSSDYGVPQTRNRTYLVCFADPAVRYTFPEKQELSLTLQGFDDSFVIPVSDAQAYKQFGNAVTVNVAEAVAKAAPVPAAL